MLTGNAGVTSRGVTQRATVLGPYKIFLMGDWCCGVVSKAKTCGTVSKDIACCTGILFGCYSSNQCAWNIRGRWSRNIDHGIQVETWKKLLALDQAHSHSLCKTHLQINKYMFFKKGLKNILMNPSHKKDSSIYTIYTSIKSATKCIPSLENTFIFHMTKRSVSVPSLEMLESKIIPVLIGNRYIRFDLK